MSCGLGAIVLVFMLVKDNPERAEPETALLQADLSRLEQLHQELRSARRDDYPNEYHHPIGCH